MDALLTAIPAIAKRADISAIISIPDLLPGTVATGSTRPTKSTATRAAASTATKSAASETSATGATTPAKSAAGCATGSKPWCAALSARTIAILSTGIIAKPSGPTPKTGTEVATRVSADLLQSATQRSIYEERLIRTIALYATGNFWLSRGAADVLAFNLIGQFRRGRSLLVAWTASLLTGLRATHLTGWRPTTRKLRRRLTLECGWPRPWPTLPGRLLRWRCSRGSRGRQTLQREIPFQICNAGELHFFLSGFKPEHFYFKSPCTVAETVQPILTLIVSDRNQRLVA